MTELKPDMQHLSDLMEALYTAIKLGASDVHFGTTTGIQFRIDGELRDHLYEPWPTSHHDGAVGALEQLLEPLCKLIKGGQASTPQSNASALNKLETAVKQAKKLGTFSDVEDAIYLGVHGTWRMSIYQSDRSGVAMALRALPDQIPTLDELIPEPLHQIKALLLETAKRARGILFVSGSVGSGKSSTIAALVDVINSTQRRVITALEDPTEFRHHAKQSVIRHRQIGVDVATYAEGLKGALRQDPNVILIGELRDLETIQLAITAAETGHLVLATLHSRDLGSAITRICDVFPAEQQAMIRAQLADSIIGVMSQRLLPNVRDGKGRVLHPELVILPDAPGGPRATIHDGRFHQLRGAFETMHGSGTGYYSFNQTASMLQAAGLISQD